MLHRVEVAVIEVVFEIDQIASRVLPEASLPHAAPLFVWELLPMFDRTSQ